MIEIKKVKWMKLEPSYFAVSKTSVNLFIFIVLIHTYMLLLHGNYTKINLFICLIIIFLYQETLTYLYLILIIQHLFK